MSMFFFCPSRKILKTARWIINHCSGLDPSNSKIIGLFSHESIRFLSDYNKEHSNKHYDLDRGLILNEICNQEACYYRILN